MNLKGNVKKLAAEFLEICRKFASGSTLKKKEMDKLLHIGRDPPENPGTFTLSYGEYIGNVRSVMVKLAPREPKHPFQALVTRRKGERLMWFEHLEIGGVTMSVQGGSEFRCHPKVWFPLVEWYSHYDVAMWYKKREREWHWLKPSDLGISDLDEHWRCGYEMENGDSVPAEDVQRMFAVLSEPTLDVSSFTAQR